MSADAVQSIYRNGSLVGSLTFNNDQLGQISFATDAIDASVAISTLVVPGTPGWVAGDRIAWYSGSSLIYLGFVQNRGQQRENIETLAIETAYQLLDANRQLIGRMLTDWSPGGVGIAGPLTFGASVGVLAFMSGFMSDLTVDTTTWVTADTTTLPGKLYTGDGITDLLADLILYTGKTAFLLPTQTENHFAFHFHALGGGATAGLSIDDTPGNANGTTVFAPHRGAAVQWSAADLKTRVVARSQTGIADVGTDATAHNAGGLKWQAVLSYAAADAALATYASSIAAYGASEIPTYSVRIGPLNGAQVIQIPAGSQIAVTSVALGLSGSSQRIASVTLTIARDIAGNPVVGWWDAALELANPPRVPSAVVGYGGQGGYSGGLSSANLPADHVTLTTDSVPIGDFPVGNSLLIYGQVEDVLGRVVAYPGITVNFALEMWADEAETVPGTGWSLNVASDDTDTSGKVQVILTRDSAGTAVVVNVVPTL